MSARREELTRIAARLFAERGYQGTSLADLAAELGVQKPSLYHHIASKEDLLWEVAWDGAEAFHAGLDGVPADAPVAERIRLALRAHLAVVAGQLDVATVFVREWRHLEGERRERFVGGAPTLRGADPGALPRGGRGQRASHRSRRRDGGAPLPLGAANWAYTWLRPGAGTEELADRLYAASSTGCGATRPRDLGHLGQRERRGAVSSGRLPPAPRSAPPRARGRRSEARSAPRSAAR